MGHHDVTRRITAGWYDATIEELALIEESLLARFPFVLVTALDSATDLRGREIGERVLGGCAECREFGKGILIPGRVLPEIARDFPLFFGFDEIWCYDRLPAIEKPDEAWILPPPVFNEAEPSLEAIEWAIQSHCRLALGDGVGMNYLVDSDEMRICLETAVLRMAR